MDDSGGAIVGPLKPVAYLVLGYCLENIEQARDQSVWLNMRDMESTLTGYVEHKSWPVNLTAGHIKAALLMLEGGYVTIERDSREAGRNLEHAFRLQVNASGKALFEQLAQEVGYPLKNITGAE